jgi:hypothetical protein
MAQHVAAIERCANSQHRSVPPQEATGDEGVA